MKIGILASTNQEFIRERGTAGVFEKSGGNRKVSPKMVSKHLRDLEDVMSVNQVLVHQSGPSHRFHKVTSRSLSVFKYMYTFRAKLRVVNDYIMLAEKCQRLALLQVLVQLYTRECGALIDWVFGFTYFWNFHPETWGFMIQFDGCIFFKWVGEKPPIS